jgi:FSR family fosmidomycin resistance protein-like MFS transporter
VLAVALSVEFADELVDGVKGAALPAIQHSLALSYPQLGLLASVPLLIGGMLELPLGLVVGRGRRRRAAIVGGGVLFVLAVAGVAFAQDFAELLAAFVVFFPASGAFVTLTQASLMDADPDRQAQSMARWDLAGSAGAVAGPLLLVGVLAVGGSWRGGYLALAVLSAVVWSGVLMTRSAQARPDADGDRLPRFRDIIAAARAAGRWLVLLEVADLLVDVLTGFVAVYLVDVVHTTPAVAALAVAIRLGAALAGDAVLVLVLERVADHAVLRATAVLAIMLYPAFLLVPGMAAKLVVLALLSAATATWYPLLQARLYGAVPSPVAVTLSSAAGLAGGLGPLAVGVVAQWVGLPWALAGLAVVPVVILTGSSRELPGAGTPCGPADCGPFAAGTVPGRGPARNDRRRTRARPRRW